MNQDVISLPFGYLFCNEDNMHGICFYSSNDIYLYVKINIKLCRIAKIKILIYDSIDFDICFILL